ncbi:hypothetical protein PIB30_049612 [Stylosanthes scabra]|uniref:Uncharacterized protein n=1 Tax=Stylosanthes scabra TaxID=79078 RepID=A0ABU6XF38_9FABA|nr:hypothetical protein [Stylosanthes scabra]
MRTHRSSECVRICAETPFWACLPRIGCVRMASLMRTHLVQQWPSRFCCDPFALSGHFRSELRLLYPETLKHTHQGIVQNGKQETDLRVLLDPPFLEGTISTHKWYYLIWCTCRIVTKEFVAASFLAPLPGKGLD